MKQGNAMTIDRWITDHAAHSPDDIAINFDGRDASYADFATDIARATGFLAQHGVARGDRVAWFGLNHPAVFTLLFACARLGAILVPVNWRLSDPEVAEVLADCAPRFCFADHNFAARTAGLCAMPCHAPNDWADAHAQTTGAGEPRDPVLIVYTSGSTGQPKGAVLQQTALISNAKMSVQAHQMQPGDAVLSVLPMFHVGGLNILPTPAFSIGARVVLHEKFDPIATAQGLEQVQLCIVVPTVLDAVLQTDVWQNGAQRNLRCLSIGSTDVPVPLLEQVVDRGIPIIQIYGATETSPFAIYQDIEESMLYPGSIGRAGSDCAIRIMAPDGTTPCATGDAGEIWVKGDNVFCGYWQHPDLTAAARTPDGWFKTGDVAFCDADGLYWFTDRIKHVIISGGENIYPAEIERLLRSYPGVGAVAVVGQADPKWGNVPVAVIEPTGPLNADDILAFLKPKLAGYKRPKRVVFVDTLPRNAMGKIVAAQVRQMIGGA